MPRRRSRSNDQRRRQDSIRKHQARTAETPADMDLSRPTDRVHKSTSQQTEPPDVRASHQSDHKRIKQSTMSTEPEDQTARCKTGNRAAMQQARSSEAAEQTMKRRSDNTVRMKRARSAEAPEQTVKRRSHNTVSMKRARSAEAPKQTAKRRTDDRVAKQRARSTEAAQQTVKRRTGDRVTKQRARSAETAERTANRQSENKQRMQRVRLQKLCNVTNVPIANARAVFEKTVNEGPIYVCFSCHRLLFRKSVVELHRDKYKCKDVACSVITECQKVNGKEWICNTCHQSLKKGQIPVQSVCNGLQLEMVPEELVDLRPLERRLISQRIPFMKLVGLPRGRQNAIHGPAVNIPTKLEKVCSLLPRLPADAEVIPIKLKRKLVYKGHYMYEYIRPQRVMAALTWLKQNNPLYKDVTICADWEEQWSDMDSELWTAMTNVDGTVPDVGETNVQQCLDRSISQVNTAELRLISSLTSLKQLCEQRGFTVQDVPSDGHCFF